MSNALKVLSDVKAAGGTVELMPPDGLRVSAPRALVEQVRVHKPEIIRFLSAPPHFDRESFDERAAIIEANGIPHELAAGFATLCTMPRPSAYSAARWRQLVDDGGRFLDVWGRQAAALGWRAVDVFGVCPYPDAPECRYDGMGLIPLLQQGWSIADITANTARIDCGGGITQTFTRKTMSADAVAIWEMGRQ